MHGFEQTPAPASTSAVSTSHETDAIVGSDVYYMSMALESLVQLKREIEINKRRKILIHFEMMVFAICWYSVVCLFPILIKHISKLLFRLD